MADSIVSYPEEKEEKPLKRRGRPRKVRDVPARNLFDGHKSSDEESVSDSDQQGHGEDNDDDDADQPLINTFRSSASKLRSLKVSQQGTSGQKGPSRASGKWSRILLFPHQSDALTNLQQQPWFLSLFPFYFCVVFPFSNYSVYFQEAIAEGTH